MLAYLSKLESKLNQVGTNLAQDASILSQVGLRKKAFLSEEKTCWRQVGPKSAPEGPRCLSQRVYTSTRLTFLIEHVHSPNFHQSTGALRMQKWPPRPPKMIKNDQNSTPKATTNDPQKILSAYAFQPPASEICLCRSKTRSVRRRYPRLRVQYMYTFHAVRYTYASCG